MSTQILHPHPLPADWFNLFGQAMAIKRHIELRFLMAICIFRCCLHCPRVMMERLANQVTCQWIHSVQSRFEHFACLLEPTLRVTCDISWECIARLGEVSLMRDQFVCRASTCLPGW